MKIDDIEKDIWVSNDRTLIENYYTLVYFKKFITDEAYYVTDEDDLSKYYIPVMKGMLNRCIRKDQKDWKFIYMSFGFAQKIRDIHLIVKEIERMEHNLNYYKIADDRFEYIREKQDKCINKLVKRNFKQLIQNALLSILEKIHERNLQDHIKMSLNEFVKSEFATRVKFEKINYKLVFACIGNVEDGMYIKDRLKDVTPGTKRKFYNRLIKVAKTNEELDTIREDIIKDEVSIEIPNSIDEKIINKYKNINGDTIDKYFEKYNSFEEAWKNREELMNSEDNIKLKFIGQILLKVENKQQLNLVNDEIKYHKIERSRGDKYHKLLYSIRNSELLNTALEVKNVMYKEGVLVDLKVYHTIIEKFKDSNDVSQVIEEMNLLLGKEIYYNNLIKNIDNAESFDECISLKEIAFKDGVKLDENIYGAMLYKAKNIEQVKLVMDEVYKQNIIFKNIASKQYDRFIRISSVDEMLISIKRAYFRGRLVDKNMYLIALNKAKEAKYIEYIKREIEFRFSNDDTEIKTNEDMMNIMLANNDLNEILKYKKKFEANGNTLDSKCYNEILYKCKTYEDAENLFKEKLQKGYDIDYSNYLNLIGLSKDFTRANQLKEEMKNYGLQCDIRIYQKLINKCNSGRMVMDVLEEIKESNISIDNKLIEAAITKADNLDQVKQMRMMLI